MSFSPEDTTTIIYRNMFQLVHIEISLKKTIIVLAMSYRCLWTHYGYARIWN